MFSLLSVLESIFKAPGVEITKLKSNLAVVRSAVSVATTPGYSTRSPPHVKRVRRVSAVCGLYSAATRRYVGFRPTGSLLGQIKLMGLVPSVIWGSTPWANRPISLEAPCRHRCPSGPCSS
jgi:hypothetical protein